MFPFIRKAVSGLLILCVLALIGGYLFYHELSDYVETPSDPNAGHQVFIVKSGQGSSLIARHLKDAALISKPFYFKLYAKLRSADKNLKAGEYRLSAAQSPKSILDMLISGKVIQYKMTIPEGFNIDEIAAVIQKENLCSADEFKRLCTDKEWIKTLGLKTFSLEGYLFPDTYFFPKGTSCPTIISAMVKRFLTVFNQTWEDRAKAMGFTRHQIVTLASIIEKETGDPLERPLISSVFHNRLKKKMRLESDPTVIYGIKNFDGNIKRSHLKMLTPYNTYRIKGLPIGPIANPGKKSLEAALYPAKTDFLFFVSKKDTTHYFSKTIEEHNRAVRKYQLGKR